MAPLSLAGVTEAVYTLTVTNGPGGQGQVVWERQLESTRFGDGAGSLSYVGTCDAATGTNTVKLVLNSLADASGTIGADTYENPTPLLREVACLENADVSVTFDMTIARDANQGFFDVAVDFDSVFCSAKLDCVRSDGTTELKLLHNPTTGARDLTAVVGLACTGSPTGETYLYVDNPVVTCDGQLQARVDASAVGKVDLAVSPNLNVDSYLFGATVFRGNEQLASKSYWNVALGLNDQAFAGAGTCQLTQRATVSDAPPFP